MSKIDVELKIPCPCGGEAMVGRTIRPGGTDVEPCIMHSLPACDAFKYKPPDEFLRYVREALEMPN